MWGPTMRCVIEHVPVVLALALDIPHVPTLHVYLEALDLLRHSPETVNAVLL